MTQCTSDSIGADPNTDEIKESTSRVDIDRQMSAPALTSARGEGDERQCYLPPRMDDTRERLSPAALSPSLRARSSVALLRSSVLAIDTRFYRSCRFVRTRPCPSLQATIRGLAFEFRPCSSALVRPGCCQRCCQA